MKTVRKQDTKLAQINRISSEYRVLRMDPFIGYYKEFIEICFSEGDFRSKKKLLYIDIINIPKYSRKPHEVPEANEFHYLDKKFDCNDWYLEWLESGSNFRDDEIIIYNEDKYDFEKAEKFLNIRKNGVTIHSIPLFAP